MKKVLVGIAALVALLFVIAGILVAVAPTEFALEKEIVINKPKAEVFEYLKNLRNQEQWGPWQKKDPNMKLTYTGTDGEVGSVAAWESDHEQVGVGEQEVTKIVDGERIENELRFKVPFESKSDGYFVTEAVGDDKTKVKWGFSGSFPRPMNIMLLFVDMDAEVGKDFDQGLADLKTVLEKRESPEPKGEDVKEEESDADEKSAD